MNMENIVDMTQHGSDHVMAINHPWPPTMIPVQHHHGVLAHPQGLHLVQDATNLEIQPADRGVIGVTRGA